MNIELTFTYQGFNGQGHRLYKLSWFDGKEKHYEGPLFTETELLVRVNRILQECRV